MKRKKILKIKDAEKIAAGEVIERPANVVKELVENSIDAGATEIRIIIKDAGKSLIQVIDDGIGIPPEDIVIAFERHTSSKIRKIEDLDTLQTLGFRGEALASIASVSRVEITTKTEKSESGMFLCIEGGKVKEKRSTPAPIGTNIKVKNLFFNLPARQKFLKSNNTELGHITDIVQRYSLANPEIHFIYQHNDLMILNCPLGNNLQTTVFHIYGKSIAKFMEPVDFSESETRVHLKGLLGHPKISKKHRRSSSLFINNRYITSDLLFSAIQDAYKGALMIGRHPFVVLFIKIDPATVDFNVHPKKLEIRFEDEKFIYNRIYHIVRQFVEDLFIQKEKKYISTDLEEYVEEKSNRKEETLKKIENHQKKLEKPIKEIRNIPKNEEDLQVIKDDHLEPAVLFPDQIPISSHQEDIERHIDAASVIKKEKLRKKEFHDNLKKSNKLPMMRLLRSTGQLSNDIYVLLEGENDEGEQGLYILDQHAASERISKEFYYDQYESTNKSRQKLISPMNIDVSPSERHFLEENLSEIRNLGFDIEHFGGNTFIVREIPVILGKAPNMNLINDMISDVAQIGKDKSFSKVKEEIINYLACHKSIRGGERLTSHQIRQLLIELSSCKDPFHCAHGRPTLRFISFKELDKLFKRVV